MFGREKIATLVGAVPPIPVLMPSDPCDANQWFASEVLPHETALRAYLRGRFPGVSDTDDIIQETFIRILHARELGRIRSPKALLFVTARNVALDVLRGRRSEPSTSAGDLNDIAAPEVAFRAADMLSHERTLELLEKAVRALPERCREVVMLKKFEGRSYEEISHKLGISHNTISAHLTVAVTKCREYLLAHGVQKGGRL